MIVRVDKTCTLERDFSQLGLDQDIPSIGNGLTLPPIDGSTDLTAAPKK